MDALPGPSFTTGVPNFVIRKFRVPVFLLPIYQAAGIQYGVRWEILAAINEIETDYGRNLNVSSAGALGWMQFIPSSWRAYGVDANKDGKKDPYNPVDAIFAAGRYLKAAGYEKDVRRSIFAYNHADWYVDSVMLRARLIAGVPGRPRRVADRADRGPLPRRRPRPLRRRPPGEGDRQAREEGPERGERDRGPGRPPLGRDLRPEGLARRRRERRRDQEDRREREARPLHRAPGRLRQPLQVLGPGLDREVLPGAQGGRDRPEEVGEGDQGQRRRRRQAVGARVGRPPARPRRLQARAQGREGRRDDAQPSIPIKERLFAHPDTPLARESGGLEQLLDKKAAKGGFETYRNYFSRPFGGDAKDVRLRRLQARLPRDRRHDPRPHRRRRGHQGLARGLLDPPGGQGRAADRPEADPRRLEAARGHRDLPRLGPQRALRRRGLRRLLDRPDPAAARSRCSRSACSRTSGSRSTTAAARTSSPARSTGACWPPSPTSPSPA